MITKVPIFYLTTILFAFTIVISVISLKTKLWIKVLMVIGGVIIFVILQSLQSNNIKEKIVTKMIENSLKTTEQYRLLVPGQRIRGNVFYLNKKKQCYYIKYQYNMIEWQDLKILIPLNLGCVGEAWRTQSQVFGDYNRIRASGEYKIPDDQLKLIPNDLTWVLSTPIRDKDGQIIAVLNLDGNKELSANQKEEIKGFSNRLVEEIQKILYGLL